MRRAIFAVLTFGEESNEKLRQFIPNDATGIS
jgi:hypothetical protein